jgi:hypothetical protein
MIFCVPQEISRDGNQVRWSCATCGKDATDLAEHFPDRIHRPCTKSAGHEKGIADAIHSLGETPQSLGLGDMTAAALSAVGLTKERYNALKREVGPCQGCADRQEWLNKMGRKLAGFLKGG